MGNISDYLTENKRFQDFQIELKDDRYTVIGILYESKKEPIVIIKCAVCSLDPEMYGEGIFGPGLQNVKKASLPCGCSKNHRKTKEQHQLKIKRLLAIYDQSLLEIEDGTNNQEDLVTAACNIHGEWQTKAREILHGTGNCRTCSRVSGRRKSMLSDEEYIEIFKKTGSYPEGVVFARSDKLTPQRFKSYWSCTCPVCKISREVRHPELVKGTVFCDCYKPEQNEAYIHLVRDTDGLYYCKFGISVNTSRRLKRLKQENKNVKIDNMLVFKFKNATSCRNAEAACKERLNTGKISKNVMPDGYTETFDIWKASEVISILEEFGGVMMDLLPSQQRAIEEMLRQEEQSKEECYNNALRKAVGVVNRADFLTTEQKDLLIKGFYK